MKTKGFTLVELLVVIAILAILATVSVVGYTSFINRAEQSNADTEAHQIETTIESYLIAGESYVVGTTEVTVEGDDPSTEDTTETSYTNTVNVVVNKDGTLSVDAADEITENADFAELTGELTVVEGKLVYVYSDEISVTITLN